MFFSAFIFGFLAAALALVLELILIAPASFSETVGLSWSIKGLAVLAIIAVIEETCKYLLLSRYLLRFARDSTSRTAQALLIGTFFGLGFAALELSLAYRATDLPHSGLGFFGIALLHIATSLALVFLMNRSEQRTLRGVIAPLGIATGIHLLYNILISLLGT
jgi:RsiW-degrading membrane proteinase PrsW (M82 family)